VDIAVVVGHPNHRSRTATTAHRVAAGLNGSTGPATLIDLAAMGRRLLDPSDTVLSQAIEEFCAADVVVVASPTFRGTYSGLTKLFLDALPAGALAGRRAIPVLVGADADHTASRDHLADVLQELGAECPTGLFVAAPAGQEIEIPEGWVDKARSVL